MLLFSTFLNLKSPLLQFSLAHDLGIQGLERVIAMRVISRYIILELIKIIAICLGVVIALYLVIDFFERIDDFLEAKLPLSLALRYFLLKLPLIVQQGIPMGVLMGTLISLGLMARSNELLALKAAGVSPALVVGPILTLALLLSLTDLPLPNMWCRWLAAAKTIYGMSRSGIERLQVAFVRRRYGTKAIKHFTIFAYYTQSARY
ncbi:MAG: hypothetical protein DRG34_06075 [Deltaproteobacteria bacterium]|nr:MAG: hypothetical protein DRG34_06075 [Deltaproteobacteria bacterium]